MLYLLVCWDHLLQTSEHKCLMSQSQHLQEDTHVKQESRESFFTFQNEFVCQSRNTEILLCLPEPVEHSFILNFM